MGRVVIGVVSDLHCRSTVGLAPPDPIHLDDGGQYVPTKAQRWLWDRWETYWERVSEVAGDDPWYLVLNGDIVDGDHHGTHQLVSRSPVVQQDILSKTLDVPLSLNPDRIFVVRGTESHVGQSGHSEEAVARGLERDGWVVEKEPDTKAHSWWHLQMLVEGVKLEFAHHGRMGRLPWTKAGLVQRDAAHIFYEYCKRGERYPDLAVRSHKHQFGDSFDAHPTRLIALGAWQLATGYVHKVAINTLADIGGIIIECEDGQYEVEKVKFQPSRGHVWVG